MSSSGGAKAIIAAFAGQPRHRDRQVRRLPPHRLVVDAGRVVHSLADTGNQGLLLLGGAPGQAGRRPRSTRSATAASATSGRSSSRSCCSRSASLFAIFEGIEKIRHPARARVARSRPSASCWSPSCSRRSRSAPRSARRSRAAAGRGLVQFIRRSKVPELPVRAARGLRRADRPGRSRSSASCSPWSPATRVWDGIGTLLIGLLLGVIAIVLAIEMKSLLIGEAADPDASSARSPPRSRPTPTCPRADPPAHRAPRPRGAARRRQDRLRPGPHHAASWHRHRPGRGRDPGRGAVGRAHLPRARPVPRLTRHRPVARCRSSSVLARLPTPRRLLLPARMPGDVKGGRPHDANRTGQGAGGRRRSPTRGHQRGGGLRTECSTRGSGWSEPRSTSSSRRATADRGSRTSHGRPATPPERCTCTSPAGPRLLGEAIMLEGRQIIGSMVQSLGTLSPATAGRPVPRRVRRRRQRRDRRPHARGARPRVPRGRGPRDARVDVPGDGDGRSCRRSKPHATSASSTPTLDVDAIRAVPLRVDPRDDRAPRRRARDTARSTTLVDVYTRVVGRARPGLTHPYRGAPSAQDAERVAFGDGLAGGGEPEGRRRKTTVALGLASVGRGRGPPRASSSTSTRRPTPPPGSACGTRHRPSTARSRPTSPASWPSVVVDSGWDQPDRPPRPTSSPARPASPSASRSSPTTRSARRTACSIAMEGIDACRPRHHRLPAVARAAHRQRPLRRRPRRWSSPSRRAWASDGVEQILRNVTRIAERRSGLPAVAGIVVNRLGRTRDARYWDDQLVETHGDRCVRPRGPPPGRHRRGVGPVAPDPRARPATARPRPPPSSRRSRPSCSTGPLPLRSPRSTSPIASPCWPPRAWRPPMAGYDPKRARPATDAPDDEPAPVDALLGDTPAADRRPRAGLVDSPRPSARPSARAAVDRAGAGRPRPRRVPVLEVPPAPDAPSSRVLVVAGVAAAALAAIFLLRRRRR